MTEAVEGKVATGEYAVKRDVIRRAVSRALRLSLQADAIPVAAGLLGAVEVGVGGAY
jgi:Arc/MetJ-type ribon-helix-helix transcriptional regulator